MEINLTKADCTPYIVWTYLCVCVFLNVYIRKAENNIHEKISLNGRLKSTSSGARLPGVCIWVLPLFMTLGKLIFLGICFLI